MTKQWYEPSKPSQIKPIPWLHERVIQHLEKLIRPDWSVIEHGSGGSTLWLAQRVYKVIAFEQNDDWYREVKKQAPENATIISGLMQQSRLVPKMEMLTGFDLALIDGEPIADRAKWLEAAPQLVKPGGWVVLDNATYPQLKAARVHMQAICESYETFDCNESATVHMVTEFYRMKGRE